MDSGNIYIGFALATFAGLSTGIGSFLGLYSKFENKRLLSISLGFALFNVIGGFLVTDRMLAMFSRKKTRK